ncbi:MAG: PilX N-terminal domain-containing pilus assembly protein [Acidobacteriota bacterium]
MRQTTQRPGVLRQEQGIALLCTLMVTMLLGMLGAVLVFLVTTESLISANQRTAQRSLYAADAGIERAIAGLRTLPDWRSVPGGGGEPSLPDFLDGASSPRLGDGTILDLAQLTTARQAESDALYDVSANRPVWALLAHAPLDRLTASRSPAPYVIVWIADDVDETDGDPLHDSNGVLMLRAEAFGMLGARRRLEATVASESQAVAVPAGGGPAMTRTEVRMISWRMR